MLYWKHCKNEKLHAPKTLCEIQKISLQKNFVLPIRYQLQTFRGWLHFQMNAMLLAEVCGSQGMSVVMHDGFAAESLMFTSALLVQAFRFMDHLRTSRQKCVCKCIVFSGPKCCRIRYSPFPGRKCMLMFPISFGNLRCSTSRNAADCKWLSCGSFGTLMALNGPLLEVI